MPVNEDDIDWTNIGRPGSDARRKRLAEAAGGERLGCSLYELPAGERAWPYHYHTGNEEALYVLDGTGKLRLGGEERPLSPGTYAAFRAGEESAHRVVNDSEEALRYLVVSTMDDPDVTVYPDSETFGVFAGSPPGSREERSLHGFYRNEDEVDFWEEVANTE